MFGLGGLDLLYAAAAEQVWIASAMLKT